MLKHLIPFSTYKFTRLINRTILLENEFYLSKVWICILRMVNMNVLKNSLCSFWFSIIFWSFSRSFIYFVAFDFHSSFIKGCLSFIRSLCYPLFILLLPIFQRNLFVPYHSGDPLFILLLLIFERIYSSCIIYNILNLLYFLLFVSFPSFIYFCCVWFSEEFIRLEACIILYLFSCFWFSRGI